MSIKPHIEGSTVTKVEVGSVIIPAKEEGLPLQNLGEVVEAFNIILNYLDFDSIFDVEEQLDEWTQKEIFDFLDDRNHRQILFFRLVSEVEEIERNELIDKMSDILDRSDFSGKQLAGTLAGIGIRTNSLEKERLYEANWVEEDDNWVCYYSLVSKYRSDIIEWLDQHGN